MTAQGATVGSLQEAMVSLERLRRREEQARFRAEALVSGIHILLKASTVAELHRGVLDLFLKVCACDHAAVVRCAPSDFDDAEPTRLAAVAQTTSGPPLSFAAAGDALARGVSEGVVIGDAAAAGFFVEAAGLAAEASGSDVAVDGARHGSAIIAPLQGLAIPMALIGVSAERHAFSHAHLAAAHEVAPLAAQAMLRAHEIAKLEAVVERLDVMASHDSLTGLANRQRFLEALDSALEDRANDPSRTFAVLHIDLDGFKAINDSLGHAAGDHVLTTVGDRLRTTLRRNDVCARFGGDEFAVLLRDVDMKSMPALAEKLRRAISAPMRYENRQLTVGASVGGALAPTDVDAPDALLRSADVALIDAKHAGRGRCTFFSSDVRDALERRRGLERGLHGAQERGELEIRYQPVVDVVVGEANAFEALLRWRSPEFGLVQPTEFLEIAEAAGLMTEIGGWVLRRACAEASGWLRARPGRRIAVNVAGCQIVAPDFVEEVVRAARDAGLEPSMLELELSEEIVVRRTAETAIDNLTELFEHDFQIAFDDFGTGYSSLQHLRRFPGQRMKIDRTFVANIENRDEDRALVQGLVDLAKSLRLAVVAEGAETRLQVELCRAAGVQEIQGFYFGRPRPFDGAVARADRAGALLAPTAPTAAQRR